MKKFEPMKFNLQYFAEGNETGGNTEGNNGADNTTGAEDTTKKNVSIDDFNNLSKTVNGIGEMMKKFMSQSQNDNNSSASNDNNSQADNTNSSSADSSANSSNSERTSWKATAEKYQKQIDELQNRLNERDEADKHSKLSSYANDIANKLGVKLGGMTESLLGGDEATTKQNVEEFAKTIKANSKTTNNGFPVNASQFKDGDSFMDNLLKNNFPNYKK